MKRRRSKAPARKPRVLKRFIESDDDDERDEEIGQPSNLAEKPLWPSEG